MVAGTNTLGILHDARTACPALPLIKSAFCPLSRRLLPLQNELGISQ